MTVSDNPTLPVVAAPSALPLNIASFLRALAVLAAGYFASHGRPTLADPNTDASIVIGVGTVLWILFKNSNAAKTLEAWMGSPEVTVIQNSLTTLLKPPTVPPAAVAALLLAFILPLVSCGSMGRLAGHAVTNAPVTPPAATLTKMLQAETLAEDGYYVLQSSYLATDAQLETLGLKATVKGYLLKMLTCTGAPGAEQCTGYLPLARTALKTADATTFWAQVAQIQFATCQGKNLIPGAAKQVCKDPSAS